MIHSLLPLDEYWTLGVAILHTWELWATIAIFVPFYWVMSTGEHR